MRFFIVSVDGDDTPNEPMLAHDETEAADLYVQAILDSGDAVARSDLKRAICIFIDEFVAPESGIGLMKDTLSTSIPLRMIPSWQRHNDPVSEGLPDGPG